MESCKTCKYWEPYGSDSYMPYWGDCRKITAVPEMSSIAFVESVLCDKCVGAGALVTHEDFGCKLWKPKESDKNE